MGKLTVESEFGVGDFVIVPVKTQHHRELGLCNPRPCLGKIRAIMVSAVGTRYAIAPYAGLAPDTGTWFSAEDLDLPCDRLHRLLLSVVGVEADILQHQVDRDSLLVRVREVFEAQEGNNDSLRRRDGSGGHNDIPARTSKLPGALRELAAADYCHCQRE